VLLRLTVALVLAGLGLLLAGVVRDTLGLIYLSILCTAIAGVALIVYVQVSRRQAERLAADLGPVDDGTGTGGSATQTAAGVGPGDTSDPAVSAHLDPAAGAEPPRPGDDPAPDDLSATSGDEKPPYS